MAAHIWMMTLRSHTLGSAEEPILAARGGSAEVIHMRKVIRFSVNYTTVLKLIHAHFQRRIFLSLVLHYYSLATGVASLTMNPEQLKSLSIKGAPFCCYHLPTLRSPNWCID
jgi:hypothetical protein